MATEKTVKLIFGETHAGSIRVMIGTEEIPNIRSVKLPEVEPGELPEIEIKMLAPRLEIEDKTQGGVTEMQEVEMALGAGATKEKPVAAAKSSSSSSRKPSK